MVDKLIQTTNEAKWTGRKLISFLLIFGVNVYFTRIGILTSEQWVNVSMVLFGLYLAGNIGAKALVQYFLMKNGNKVEGQ